MRTRLRVRLTAAMLVLIVLAALAVSPPPAYAAGPWYVAPGGNDSSACTSPATACATINAAIGKASPGDTIYVAIGTYTATGDQVVLIDKDATLSGGWDEAFTAQSGTSVLDGEDSRRGITLNSGVTATVDRFTVRSGSTRWYTGAIHSDSSGSGHLSLDTAGHSIDPFYGGGIYVDDGAALILNNSAVSGNAAQLRGGGIYLRFSTVTLSNSIVVDNVANDGAGIANDSGTLVLNECTVHGNMTSGSGGGLGIDLRSGGSAAVNNSTVSHNTAIDGGGVLAAEGGILILNNTTITRNRASHEGGGLLIGAFTVVSSQNSILAGNIGAYGPDCVGAISSLGYNLIGNTFRCGLTPARYDLVNVNPGLGPLVGDPGYHPLLQSSPAIDAGNPAGCRDHLRNPLDTDQRGAPRVGRCDIGSYEYMTPGPAASVSAIAGTPQRTPPSVSFWMPFQVVVLDGIGNPVDGVSVEFSAPLGGASGAFADTGTNTTTAMTDNGGVAAAADFAANTLTGNYAVTATVGDVTPPALFSLANIGWYVSTDGDDTNDCQATTTPCATMDGALNKPGFVSEDTVLVASGTYTSTREQVVLLGKSVRLLGGWDRAFTSQSGSSTVDARSAGRCITVDNYANVLLERFTIIRGWTEYGGGIFNRGALTLNHSLIRGNFVKSGGGGVYNDGALTANHSAFIGNSAGGGGGIRNGGILTLNESSVIGSYGTGIFGDGYIVLNKSIVCDNISSLGYEAGGIGIWYGTLILNDSTVSGNRADSVGGGVFVDASDASATAVAFLNNSTVSNNIAETSGGGIYVGGRDQVAVTIQNAIVADNSSPSGPDCSGTVGSDGYNLIGDTLGCSLSYGPGDLTNVAPRLFPLMGSPAYHPLLPSSPAIDAGNPVGCVDHSGAPLTTDQRGVARVGRCDIGAYEYDPEVDPLRYALLPVVVRQYGGPGASTTVR